MHWAVFHSLYFPQEKDAFVSWQYTLDSSECTMGQIPTETFTLYSAVPNNPSNALKFR